METTIVKIGNSNGLIIPKKLLTSFGECKTVDIQIRNGALIVRPLTENGALQSWEKQFAEAIAKGYLPEHDASNFENEFDKKEWTW